MSIENPFNKTPIPDASWAMSPKAFEQYEKETEEKRTLLEDFWRGDHSRSFGKVASELSGDSKTNFEYYLRLMWEVVFHLPKFEPDQFRAMLEGSLRNSSEASGRSLGAALKKERPARGLKIAEIGGTLSRRLLEPLGASVETVDRGSDLEPQGQLVSIDTWDGYLPEQYDFTLSNFVFSPGSGVEELVSKRGVGPASGHHTEAAQELLLALHNATKDGGFSIHADFETRMDPALFSAMGWDVRPYREWSTLAMRVTDGFKVLRKRKPTLDRHKLFDKVITWNKEKGLWQRQV